MSRGSQKLVKVCPSWIRSSHFFLLFCCVFQHKCYLLQATWCCTLQPNLVYTCPCSYSTYCNRRKSISSEPIKDHRAILWNLDIFRSILPDICLNVTTLEALALEVCIAVYPLILICVSYCLIELYDHNLWCIVHTWRPFRYIFRLFRENWDIRTSVIDSFATFYLLSYVKILSVSANNDFYIST